MTQTNDHLVLITGKSATGKSASMMGMETPERLAYFNFENGKKLPFRSNMKQIVITDVMGQTLPTIQALAGNPDYDGVIMDSLTFMMDMVESQYVLKSANTMKAWGDYAQFFINLMNEGVAKSDKFFIFTAHTSDIYNESEMVSECMVKVKGSLMNNGIESRFTNVISTKKLPLTKLKGYENDLLIITPEEEMLGFKYVFQTRLTKESVNERIRAPINMWSIKETYIDNKTQYVIDRLKQFYN